MNSLPCDSMDWIMEEAYGLVEASEILANCGSIRGRSAIRGIKKDLLSHCEIVREARTRAWAGGLGGRGGLLALLAMVGMARLAHLVNKATFAEERSDIAEVVADAVTRRVETWLGYIAAHPMLPEIMDAPIARGNEDSVIDSTALEAIILELLSDARRRCAALKRRPESRREPLVGAAEHDALHDLIVRVGRDGERLYHTLYAIDGGSIHSLAIWRSGDQALEISGCEPPCPGEPYLRSIPLQEVASEIVADGQLAAASGGRLVACAACRGDASIHAAFGDEEAA
jgi:hypothetical protein